MTVTFMVGDVRRLLAELPAGSVDLIATVTALPRPGADRALPGGAGQAPAGTAGPHPRAGGDVVTRAARE